MAVLSWGKPTIKISKLDNNGDPTTWIDIDNPKEDTTTLATTQGDKLEATGEGGAQVDVMYKRSTYELNFTLFQAKNKTKPVADDDGVITGVYAIKVQPEDKDLEGIRIDKASLSCQDSWDAQGGGLWQYTASVLVPDDNSTQIKWEKITF